MLNNSSCPYVIITYLSTFVNSSSQNKSRKPLEMLVLWRWCDGGGLVGWLAELSKSYLRKSKKALLRAFCMSQHTLVRSLKRTWLFLFLLYNWDIKGESASTLSPARQPLQRRQASRHLWIGTNAPRLTPLYLTTGAAFVLCRNRHRFRLLRSEMVPDAPLY